MTIQPAGLDERGVERTILAGPLTSEKFRRNWKAISVGQLNSSVDTNPCATQRSPLEVAGALLTYVNEEYRTEHFVACRDTGGALESRSGVMQTAGLERFGRRKLFSCNSDK